VIGTDSFPPCAGQVRDGEPENHVGSHCVPQRQFVAPRPEILITGSALLGITRKSVQPEVDFVQVCWLNDIDC